MLFNALLFIRERSIPFQMREPRDQVFEVRLTKAEVAWLDRIRKLKKHREPDVGSMLQKLTEMAVEIPPGGSRITRRRRNGSLRTLRHGRTYAELQTTYERHHRCSLLLLHPL